MIVHELSKNYGIGRAAAEPLEICGGGQDPQTQGIIFGDYLHGEDVAKAGNRPKV